MKVLFTFRSVQALIFAAAVLVTACGLNIAVGTSLFPTVAAQTDRLIESRINMIEQRFYALESRLNRAEQNSVRPTISLPAAPDNSAELQFLRNQIDGLRTRVGELECAALKLDERTLTAAARSRRTRTAGNPAENCRLDSGEPVRLSSRP